MDFASTVKEVLKSKNLTPSDLARMTEYTPQYIHELIGGKRRWNETLINKTCQVLGLTIKIHAS